MEMSLLTILLSKSFHCENIAKATQMSKTRMLTTILMDKRVQIFECLQIQLRKIVLLVHFDIGC